MGTVDWLVVTACCLLVFIVGLWFARRASVHGAESYFAGGRDVPWWAIGLSNTATYSSGNGAFVAVALTFGLAGNWLWWAQWIIWMPLVAIIWARMWRRMQIVTTAELISLRYGGTQADWARRLYAFVCCFGFAVLIISYITGFFAKTIAPLCPLNTVYILLIFGGITVVYSMFGGLLGVVYADVVQFGIMMVGSALFLWWAIPQHGGWDQIIARVTEVRPEALAQTPPTSAVSLATVFTLMLLGWFFAGSPTAGEGMTAQRFMSARNERHAIGGQLFNAFLALSFRCLPLIGLGIVAMSLFWTSDPNAKLGSTPAGMTMIEDPAYAWGELIKQCRLPLGFVGLLVAAEAAAYMSTLSSVINWGSSFVINDLLPRGMAQARDRIWASRLTSLSLFLLAALVTVCFVDNMMSWFLFINSVMVIFLLPLSWFRFFWWRFNVWGEMAAIVLGLPLSILVWFVLGFDDASKHPPWHGISILFALSFVVLIGVTLLTPAEKPETLQRFYARCRPPGWWGPVRKGMTLADTGEPSMGHLMFDAILGILACLGLVLATNAFYVKDWWMAAAGTAGCVVLGAWLLRRVLGQSNPGRSGGSSPGEPPQWVSARAETGGA